MWVKNMSLGYVHTYNACSLVMLAYLTCQGKNKTASHETTSNNIQWVGHCMSLNYVSQQTCEDIRTISKTQYVWLIRIRMHSGKKKSKKSHQHFPKQLQWVTTKHSFSITSPPSKLTLALKKKEGGKRRKGHTFLIYTNCCWHFKIKIFKTQKTQQQQTIKA